jgi:molybdopterin biosynthesis enzyme
VQIEVKVVVFVLRYCTQAVLSRRDVPLFALAAVDSVACPEV